MKNREQILANIAKNNPMINCHKHAFTKDHVPSDFKNVKISKKSVIGIPMKEWFLKPLEWVMRVASKLPVIPQGTRNTIENTRNFIDILDLPNSIAVFEESLRIENR